MASKQAMNLADVSNKKNDTFTFDALLSQAVKEKYGRRARIWYQNYFTRTDKKTFTDQLFTDAKNVNPREPVEISKNLVDVNEKIYSNCDGSTDDESTVKVVSRVENSEDHNYHESTTKGVQWGTNANVGLQFGLPQVFSGGGINVGGSFQRTTSTTVAQEEKKSNKVEAESHHEELVKIPPGKKVVVKLTSYRVRYRLDYTMEYKISKSANIRVKYEPCGIGLPCLSLGIVTASELMQPLPGYREDEEFVYMTQEGVLRWTADRMEVKKTLANA